MVRSKRVDKVGKIVILFMTSGIWFLRKGNNVKNMT